MLINISECVMIITRRQFIPLNYYFTSNVPNVLHICFVILLSAYLLLNNKTAYIAFSKTTIETIWGETKVDNQFVEDLLKSKTLERIKLVDQSGPITYFGFAPFYSRYDHSVGVLALLIKANASINEQAAGLLHDVSHTAFSHIGDLLFDKENGNHSYQDKVHLNFLNDSDVIEIIKHHKVPLEVLNPDLEEYAALERNLPELCADRIEYNVHTSLMLGYITEEEARELINDLQFENGKWFFTNAKYAKKFAECALRLNKEFIGAYWNTAIYHLFKNMLMRAVEIRIISAKDLKYGTDINLLNVLYKSDDPLIKELLHQCRNVESISIIVPYGEGDINTQPKFRGVDPNIKIGGKLVRLSKIDKDFKENFESIKSWCKKGYGLKFRSI